ncbi:MAG: hypothetical protein H0S79_24135 [Anaerolineaceae bacterium]|nr:hypothetical protein [Anaerolineaceae bacterium]
MSVLSESRYISLKGPPYQVGRQLGERLQKSLADDIAHYLDAGPLKAGEITSAQLSAGALDWAHSLPQRFLDEMEGLADGSGVPLQRIAEWGFADSGGKTGCSAFLLRTGDGLWVGRNNDLWVPDLWGYAIQRQVNGRLGTVSFGMQGELYAATGVNASGLWLHYNWLPALGQPDAHGWTPFVLLTDILETCETIDAVEARLRSETRLGGMLIFSASPDGRATILECSCCRVARRDLDTGFLVGTNHYQFISGIEGAVEANQSSHHRAEAMVTKLGALPNNPQLKDLIAVLADPNVEQHGDDYGTVYANLYNPISRQLWFTFGGYPAASQGNWQPVPGSF